MAMLLLQPFSKQPSLNLVPSGYNTTQALKVLSSIVPAPAQAKVRFMVEMIFFGANDACSVEASNGQHVPLETYKLNLRDIVTHPVVQAHEPRIILVTPPAVEERLLEQRVKSFGYKELNRSNAVTKLYADAVHEVGKANNIAVLDLWSAFMTEAGWKAGDPLPGSLSVPKNAGLRRLLVDGLHFNPDGYRILYAELMKLIEKRWPEQIPETLSYVLPAWDDRLEWAKEGLQMGQPDVAIHE
ncbi:hypothetical protein MMC09_003714 [Bachmanniomyces sp. S44760]|nr:hypothetical protein [Bachmanniomyces sp. S44760]